MSIKPITPKEIALVKQTVFPEFVIKSFNELIAANYSDGSSTVMQKEVVIKIKEYEFAKFNNDWLNVEEIYRKAGWEVTYDGPGFNESYEPHYIFRKKRK